MRLTGGDRDTDGQLEKSDIIGNGGGVVIRMSEFRSSIQSDTVSFKYASVLCAKNHSEGVASTCKINKCQLLMQIQILDYMMKRIEYRIDWNVKAV